MFARIVFLLAVVMAAPAFGQSRAAELMQSAFREALEAEQRSRIAGQSVPEENCRKSLQLKAGGSGTNRENADCVALLREKYPRAWEKLKILPFEVLTGPVFGPDAYPGRDALGFAVLAAFGYENVDARAQRVPWGLVAELKTKNPQAYALFFASDAEKGITSSAGAPAVQDAGDCGYFISPVGRDAFNRLLDDRPPVPGLETLPGHAPPAYREEAHRIMRSCLASMPGKFPAAYERLKNLTETEGQPVAGAAVVNTPRGPAPPSSRAARVLTGIKNIIKLLVGGAFFLLLASLLFRFGWPVLKSCAALLLALVRWSYPKLIELTLAVLNVSMERNNPLRIVLTRWLVRLLPDHLREAASSKYLGAGRSHDTGA